MIIKKAEIYSIQLSQKEFECLYNILSDYVTEYSSKENEASKMLDQFIEFVERQ